MNLIIRGFMVISHYFATPFPPGPLLTNVVFSKDLKLFDKIVFFVFENVNCVGPGRLHEYRFKSNDRNSKTIYIYIVVKLTRIDSF